MPCGLLVSFSLYILLEPLGIVTKVEKEGEEEEEKEEKEEGKERKKGEEEEEGKERMSYPGDPMLEDESLQYRVQGTFSQHRYSYLHCYKALLVILTSFGLNDRQFGNHVGLCGILLQWSRRYVTFMFVSVTYFFYGAYFI
jgi:hypothetical protein